MHPIPLYLACKKKIKSIMMKKIIGMKHAGCRIKENIVKQYLKIFDKIHSKQLLFSVMIHGG